MSIRIVCLLMVNYDFQIDFDSFVRFLYRALSLVFSGEKYIKHILYD